MKLRPFLRLLFPALCLCRLLCVSAQDTAKERWVYAPANYQVNAEADRIIALMQRAKAAGYTHFLITDSKFARLHSVVDRYFDNVKRVRAKADELDLHLIPAVFGVGYSNDLLSNDPNLAEGLPVKDALFVVKDFIAGHVPDPDVRLKDPGFLNRKSWGFIDDNLITEGNALRSDATDKNARFSQKLKVQPFRQYHISVQIKAEGFKGGQAEIKAIVGSAQLNYTSLSTKADQDWTTHHITFNSLTNSDVQLYFGVWGGHQGTLSWRQPQIEECGLVNVLRRPGTPFIVKREDGSVLKEGTDYEPFHDPKMGTVPYGGEYEPWHEPALLHLKGIEDGVRLRISYYHPHIIYEHQVCACVSEPAFMDLLKQQAAGVHKLWDAKSYMMNHDEWRVMNWCAACQQRQLTPGQIAADNVRACTTLLHDTTAAGKARLFVWNDMFDPHHNAKPNYYLVNGPLTDSWSGLDPKVGIVNWNSGKAPESLAFFSERGHSQIIAGYYDGPLKNTRTWLQKAKGVKGVLGVMYTTWKNNYTELENFGKMLGEEGF